MKIKKVHWLFRIHKQWFTCNTLANLETCALFAEAGQPYVDKWCAEDPPNKEDYYQLEFPSKHWSHEAERLIFELDWDTEICT